MSLDFIVPTIGSTQNIILLTLLSIATKTDLKSKTIPDKLIGPALIISAIMALGESLLRHDMRFITMAFLGFGLSALIGIALIKVGFWYGGDAKLLMVVGAILTLNVFLVKFYFYLMLCIAVPVTFTKLKNTKEEPALAPAFLGAYLLMLVLAHFNWLL